MIETLSFVNDMLTEPHLSTLFVSVIIKSSLVLSATAVILYLLRNKSAVTRSFALSLAIAVCLVLPVLCLTVPAWQSSLTGQIASVVSTTTIKASATGLKFLGNESDATFAISAFTVGVLVWAVGTVFLLLRLMTGWLLVRGVTRRSAPIKTFTIGRLIESLSDRLNLRHRVDLRESDEISSPMAVGIFSPVILFPSAIHTWSTEDIEMSLTHELAHVKRHDTMWFVFGSLATALYWFNPLIWWCRRKLVTETEKVCDDHVLMCGCDACTYAECLLGLARQIGQKRFTISFGATMAKESELEGRLMSILSDRKRSFGVKNTMITVGLALTIALVLPLAGMQLQAGDSDGSKAKVKTSQVKKNLDEKPPTPTDFVAVTTFPEMITSVAPEYPEEAKKQNLEGEVTLQVLVNKLGKVQEAKVSKTSGHDLLDKSALDAAYKCTYTPALQDSTPVFIWISYNTTFDLDDEKKATE